MVLMIDRHPQPPPALPALLPLLLPLLLQVCSSEASTHSFVSVENVDGVWWFRRGSDRFLSIGVSNLNDGGPDDGVGDVLGRECRAQQKTSLCGDTNNWDMLLNYAPYFNVTRAIFRSNEEWATDAASRLDSWHFNTISGYSSTTAERAVAKRGNMFYNRLLMFATRFAMPFGTPLQQSTAGGCFGADVFSADFEEHSDQYAKRNVEPRANDTALLGWHFEKEVSWNYMDLRYWLNPELFPVGSSGRAAAISFVKQQYDFDVDELNRAYNCSLRSFDELSSCVSPAAHRWQCQRTAVTYWPPGVDAANVRKDSTEFILVFAKRYFEVVTAAIRRYDSNHLLFGMRGGCFGSHSMLSLFANYVDVYDVHKYNDDLGLAALLQEYELVHNITGLPILHGEFSYTAIDSGVPNLRGARSCPTPPQCVLNHPFVLQRDRAAQARKQVMAIAAVPYLVGYHWWRWVDETPGGRWPRGENSNYGLVRISNEAYSELTSAFTECNGNATSIHNKSTA
eukprot:SAG31_NODE_4504_length_3181_cov_1.851720_2_plen_510_part_00